MSMTSEVRAVYAVKRDEPGRPKLPWFPDGDNDFSEEVKKRLLPDGSLTLNGSKWLAIGTYY